MNVAERVMGRVGKLREGAAGVASQFAVRRSGETRRGVPPERGLICLCSPPPTSSRDHSPAAAATPIPWLSFGFQRPHRPDFKLFWSAAAAAAGLGCLSRRVCAVKPKDVVNVFGRCRPVKTRRRLRVHRDRDVRNNDIL